MNFIFGVKVEVGIVKGMVGIVSEIQGTWIVF